MKKFKIIFHLILLTTSLSFGQTNPAFTKADHYKTSKFDVAIFPANYIDLIPGERFTPTREDIDKAEISLRNDLEALNKQLINQYSTPITHKKLHKYRRQYFGYRDKNGNRILLINCFWLDKKELSDNWLTNQISVSDGGSYYWNIKFNLETGKLFELDING